MAETRVGIAEWASFDRFLRIALPVCILLTLSLGIGKVYRQKAHHPASYDKPIHVFEGFMAIDGHAAIASSFEAWLHGEDPHGAEVKKRLAESLHPSAIAVPFVVACLATVIGSIPIAFLVLSAAATCMQVWLASLLVTGARDDVAPAAKRLASLLTCGHCFTIATCAQLYLDPFVAVGVSASCILASRWIESPGWRFGAPLLLVNVVGLFTKVSFAPVLAVPCLAALLSARESRFRRAFAAAVWFAIVPWIVWWGFLSWIADSASIGRESAHLWSSWRLGSAQITHFLVEMLILFQVFPLFVLKRSYCGTVRELAIAIALILLLCATWIFALPAVHRLYLPEVALLAAMAAPTLFRRLSPGFLLCGVILYLAANYGLGVALLFIGGS